MKSHQPAAAQAAIRYRPTVAAIVRNARGEILVCERRDQAGAWQFPQGGVDEGETREEALVRELGEEVSLGAPDVRIVSHNGPYRYLFPPGFTKHGCQGTEQFYFMVDLIAPPSKVSVDTPHPEFQALKWITPGQFDLGWLPSNKREVYRQVLCDFFGPNPALQP